MIEQAIVVYVNTVPAVVAALGGQKFYYARAPLNTKMPYATIKNSGGSRKRESLYITEPRDTMTIYVESEKLHEGLAIANTIRESLENYRGDMAPERDIYITCGTVRDLDGFQGSFRFIIPVYVRYRQTTTFPN